MTMILGPTSSEITIDANWGYTFTEIQEKSVNRGATGTLGSFINSPTYFRLEIPVSHITSSDHAIVNSWFNASTTLRYFEDFGVSAVQTVRITGDTEPFSAFADPYSFKQYTGILVIESVV